MRLNYIRNPLTNNYRNILIPSHVRQTLIFTDITLVAVTNCIQTKLTMIFLKTFKIQDNTNINTLPDNVIRKRYTHSMYGQATQRNILFPTMKLSYHLKLLHMSMLNAVIISDMPIVTCIIMHTHPYGRNVMLRSSC